MRVAIENRQIEKAILSCLADVINNGYDSSGCILADISSIKNVPLKSPIQIQLVIETDKNNFLEREEGLDPDNAVIISN